MTQDAQCLLEFILSKDILWRNCTNCIIFQAIQASNLFLYRIIGEPVLRGGDKQNKTINSNAYLDTNYCMENLGYAHFKTSSLFSSHSMNSVLLLLFRSSEVLLFWSCKTLKIFWRVDGLKRMSKVIIKK